MASLCGLCVYNTSRLVRRLLGSVAPRRSDVATSLSAVVSRANRYRPMGSPIAYEKTLSCCLSYILSIQYKCNNIIQYKCNNIIQYKCNNIIQDKCNNIIQYKCNNIIQYKCNNIIQYKCNNIIQYKCNNIIQYKYNNIMCALKNYLHVCLAYIVYAACIVYNIKYISYHLWITCYIVYKFLMCFIVLAAVKTVTDKCRVCWLEW